MYFAGICRQIHITEEKTVTKNGISQALLACSISQQGLFLEFGVQPEHSCCSISVMIESFSVEHVFHYLVLCCPDAGRKKIIKRYV